MKKILLFLMLLCSNAFGAITDGKFGINQIFDVQYWWNGTTLNASSFVAPYDMNWNQPTLSAGQYFAFFPSTTVPGDWGLGIYNSNGTLASVVHDNGTITALGNSAIFYLGSGFFGNVITTTQGYSYGSSAQFTNMDTNVSASDLSNYTFASSTPLAAGQTAQPTAPVVTVTGTTTSYTTRTVVNGNTTTVYRTPVTTTTYSDGTSTSTSGTESLYQTKVASNVVTTKIVGTTLTTTTTPINTVTTTGVSGTTVEANGAATTTTQTVQQGLNYKVYKFDPYTYNCGWLGCLKNLLGPYRVPDMPPSGQPTNVGITGNGVYVPTNGSFPNIGEGTLVRFNGTITAPTTQNHPAGTVYRLYFYSNSDDGFVMSVNGQTVINDRSTFQLQSIGGYTASGWIDIVAGQTYNFEAWYWNDTGGYGLRFQWDFGAGRMNVPNSAFTTGWITETNTIDTSGLAYSNTSVVDMSGTSVTLGPVIEGGTITQNNAPGDQVIGSGGSYTPPADLNVKQARIDQWNNTAQSRNNELYIEQTYGTNNSVTIVQEGTKNRIDFTLEGNNNVVNNNQVGSNYLKQEIPGWGNSVTTSQTNTSGSNYAETKIQGNGNTVNHTQNGTGNHILFSKVQGDINTVTTNQSGSAGHFADIKLTGNNNSALLTQSGNTANSAVIDLTNAGGPASVDLQQSGGKSFSIIQSCINPAGCTTTVRQQ